jgi:hypothetical protein
MSKGIDYVTRFTHRLVLLARPSVEITLKGASAENVP